MVVAGFGVASEGFTRGSAGSARGSAQPLHNTLPSPFASPVSVFLSRIIIQPQLGERVASKEEEKNHFYVPVQ